MIFVQYCREEGIFLLVTVSLSLSNFSGESDSVTGRVPHSSTLVPKQRERSSVYEISDLATRPEVISVCTTVEMQWLNVKFVQ